MAKRKHTEDANSSEDDAPETFSFGSSKKAAKGDEEAVRQFQAAEQHKQKERNRAIDRKLKARAAEVKGKSKSKSDDASATHWAKATRGKGVAEDPSEDDDAGEGEADDTGRSALEERMARAMREADEEDSDEDGEASAFEGFSKEGADLDEDTEEDETEADTSGEDSEAGTDESGEDGSEDEDEDGDMGSESEGDEEEDEDEATPGPSSSKPTFQKRNYLPDHLFKSALSSAHNTKIKFDDEGSLPSRAHASPPRKRRRASRSTKDIMLGSRTIRTLSKPSQAISPAAAKGLPPPRRVNKFMKRSLNMKGDARQSKTKGWSRQAANLGVMKRNGPAAHFVRSS
ncbi:hypothetical protein C2E23DRAFT_743087 [Lenzites betulinus]|nr:hypothetical protein C2E23DRAFT_743087 [Lenzites betulinus]